MGGGVDQKEAWENYLSDRNVLVLVLAGDYTAARTVKTYCSEYSRSMHFINKQRKFLAASLDQAYLCSNEIKSARVGLWSHPDTAATMSGECEQPSWWIHSLALIPQAVNDCVKSLFK